MTGSGSSHTGSRQGHAHEPGRSSRSHEEETRGQGPSRGGSRNRNR
jgi:hypothetical protein